ncbi:hypothetical protein CORC01_13479 [Colletotrichum orchidophilum]|uniref:Uncharacterized protein n=1 Tax=Colletotrichum orchidophilum TaxID=1209926 RepID=A0A1G4AQA2_9PEZI|nr:uncharacterized protein CORC01_13479 [Colletotrichum orchidophilum]OHE91202.1 hypothetical protein CORC01_13479 [Colletotrichum orchidophilum]
MRPSPPVTSWSKQDPSGLSRDPFSPLFPPQVRRQLSTVRSRKPLRERLRETEAPRREEGTPLARQESTGFCLRFLLAQVKLPCQRVGGSRPLAGSCPQFVYSRRFSSRATKFAAWPPPEVAGVLKPSRTAHDGHMCASLSLVGTVTLSPSARDQPTGIRVLSHPKTNRRCKETPCISSLASSIMDFCFGVEWEAQRHGPWCRSSRRDTRTGLTDD